METLLPLLKPGGTFVYSTCSLEPEEGEWMADELAKEIPHLSLVAKEHRYPHENNTDGAFAAKFVKEK